MGLASQKPNPKLTPNTLTSNHKNTQKEAQSNTRKNNWEPRQNVLQWVPKKPPQQRPKPRRKKRQKKYSSCSQWVPKELLKAQGYYEGNSWIWIPKRIVPTSPIPKEKHEAIVVPQDKGKTIIQEPPPTPHTSTICATHTMYEQGESSCKSMENLSRSSSLISSKRPYVDIVNPQVSINQMEANISKVLPLDKTNKPEGDVETLPASNEFDEVVHKVNQAKDFLEHTIKASANWFTTWKLPELQNILPSHQLQEV